MSISVASTNDSNSEWEKFRNDCVPPNLKMTVFHKIGKSLKMTMVHRI